ncbi:MAG TPA: hypothetical protein VFV66_37075 [Nonomuraea sp.]|nr:hypothetical protein [Nonomuraea sp.]
MSKSALTTAGVLVAAAVIVTPATAGTASAAAGAASAHTMAFSQELSAVARAAGVSEATVRSMAMSIVDNAPEDEYRFPDEAFTEAPRSWGAILAFIKRFWRQIVDAAKASAKWAWYKAKDCAVGAVSEVQKRFGSDLTNPELVLAAATFGCIKGLGG